MLMPLEVEEKVFSKQMRGYNKDEVDAFMGELARDYEKLYKENLASRDKIATLTEAITQYKTMEETLQSAILVAQSAGDEVIQNAKKRAENIIADAETKAAQMLSDASREVTRVSYEYEDMKRNVEVFRTRIISLLTSQLDIVKEFNMPIEGKTKAEGVKMEAPHIELENIPTEQPKEVMSTLQKLERVTMELPRIVENEKGEFVVADTDEEAKGE